MNWLLNKVCKYIHSLFPEIMNKVFSIRANIYNKRNFNVYQTYITTTNRYGLNSMYYKANQIWNLLPEGFESSQSMVLFKNKIKWWECCSFPCIEESEFKVLCFTQLILLLHSHQFWKAALHRCSYKKVFWKHVSNLQESTHAEVISH